MKVWCAINGRPPGKVAVNTESDVDDLKNAIFSQLSPFERSKVVIRCTDKASTSQKNTRELTLSNV
eukprot:4827095-Amphidinium_carterae.1